MSSKTTPDALTVDKLFETMVAYFRDEYPDNLNIKTGSKTKIAEFPSCDGIYRFPNPFTSQVIFYQISPPCQ
jgi:hypothetical protein